MRHASMLSWILAGGLLASTLWNITLSQRLDALETAPQRAEQLEALEPLPQDLVTRLELTKEQCQRIRSCSRT